MQDRNIRDIAAGAVMLGIGLFVALYALANYPLGTLNRMGPGMLPMSLGAVLAMLGAGVGIHAFFHEGGRIEVDIRPLVAVLASVASFALTAERFGMVPAIVITTGIAALADTKLNLFKAAILAICLSVFCAAVFVFGLGIQLQLFRWRP